MNQELIVTWTPILKQLPDEEREQARQLIEKYGESNPSNFIVELLAIFGVHATYLQTIPAQVRIAGERAKADVQQSIDAVTALHERTRLELNELISAVSRNGASFTKALETAATAQVRATEKSAKELKATIVEEFTKQNLPALANCLREIESKTDESLRKAKSIHEQAEILEDYAKGRLASVQERCKASLEKVEDMNWRGAWMVCISCSLALLVIAAFFMDHRFRSRSNEILAQRIAQASGVIQENKDAFAELAIAGIRLKVHRAADPQTGGIAPSEFAILVENAEAAEMRDYGNSRAGFIFVKGPTPEEEINNINTRLQEILNDLQAASKSAGVTNR